MTSLGRNLLRRLARWVRCGMIPEAVILMYHRVDDVELDPWGLAVSPRHFDHHLQVLRERSRPLSLAGMLNARQRGRLPRRSVVVTFDDGYADNLYHAAPLLMRHQIPATVFVTVGGTGSEREFWWDELAHMMLRPGRLPSRLELEINGAAQQWELGGASDYRIDDYRRDRDRRPWEAVPNSRLAFYYAVWKALRPLPYGECEQALDTLRHWAETAPRDPSYRPLSEAELRVLSDGGLVEIGGHTLTHPSLPAHPPALQRTEIHECKARLEQMLQRPITSFAYPFGDYVPATAELVRDAGYTCACTTAAARVKRTSDPFELPRFEVRNWSRDEFAGRLRGWLRD